MKGIILNKLTSMKGIFHFCVNYFKQSDLKENRFDNW